MPIKKKTTAAKKPAVLGPKAKLMKLAVTTLRNKAKKLGVSDVSKRTKENLVQSIILGEARKKRGTAAGKKATAKRTMSAGVRQSTRQTGTSKLKRDLNKPALAPGRRVSKAGNVYYERRKNRSDKPGQLAGEKYNGWTNYWTWKWNLELIRRQLLFVEMIEEGNYRLISMIYRKYLKGTKQQNVLSIVINQLDGLTGFMTGCIEARSTGTRSQKNVADGTNCRKK
jgi:hypothetical protein